MVRCFRPSLCLSFAARPIQGADDVIRILHVFRKMDLGGAETLIMNLYHEIDRSEIQFDFVVHVPEKGALDDEIRAMGGKIYVAPMYNIVNYPVYTAWWHRFLTEHPEYTLVHGHIGSSAAVYLKTAKTLGRYTVAHGHNTRDTIFNPTECLFRIMSFPTRYVADHFFCCSRQAGVDMYGKKVGMSDRCEVLRNAIRVEKYQFTQETRERVRRGMHIADEICVVGHVGRMTRQKNHDWILEVFRAFHRLHPASQLWLIGKGELEEKLKKKTAEMGLKDSVLFLGTTQRVQDYLQAMDLFLFPSRFEGLGNVLIEAQAAGLPCVVSEAIQDEAVLSTDRVARLELSQDVQVWAETVENYINKGKEQRAQQAENVIEAGFDFRQTAGKLADFYRLHAKNGI